MLHYFLIFSFCLFSLNTFSQVDDLEDEYSERSHEELEAEKRNKKCGLGILLQQHIRVI